MARSVPSHINISSNVFSSVPSCHPQFHQVLWARQVGGDEKWMNQWMNMWISTLTKNFEMSLIHLSWFGLHGGVVLLIRGLKKLVWCSVRWWWVVEVEVEDVGYHDASKAYVIVCSTGCRKAYNLKQHIKSSFGLGVKSRKCLRCAFVHR